jgi:hypothetical protein
MNFYLAVLVGCFLYILLQLNDVYNLPGFNWKQFFRTNWVPTMINLVVGSILITAKGEIVNLYPITLLSSVMLGAGGQAVWKKISHVFSSRVDTVVGVSKNEESK